MSALNVNHAFTSVNWVRQISDDFLNGLWLPPSFPTFEKWQVWEIYGIRFSR